MPTIRLRFRQLVLLAVATCWFAFPAGSAWGTTRTLFGGESSFWLVADSLVTTNGAPVGGECAFGADGSGAGIVNADSSHGIDPFDFATMAWVGGVPVGGEVDTRRSFQDASFTPVTISGLTVQMNYRALSMQSTLRVLLRLGNTTAAPITVPVEYVDNYAAGIFTQVAASSTGDGGYDPEDRWIVITGKPSTSNADLTSVFYGPDSPPVTASSGSSSLVFECGDTQGTLERFIVTVPAGGVSTLMFFEQINPTIAEAQADAAQFNTTPQPGQRLTQGMAGGDFASIVNWNYAGLTRECSDGVDNDVDGKIDFPADRNCTSASDPSESVACDDGQDNDRDGKVDFPGDPSCTSPSDDFNEATRRCHDGLDNDGDGHTDWPNDPGCSSPTDNNETNERCNDGLDNDNDGKIDYPADPGCASLRDNNETNARCNDGLDNDNDGQIDYPNDPGCTSLTDNNETNAQCNDGLDNDGDGNVDFPADTGCSSLTDNRENTAPTVALTTDPGPGDPFQFGDTIAFDVVVTDDAPVDCSRVVVTYILRHDQHGHARDSRTGCTGTLPSDPNDSTHGQNLAARILAQYTDAGGLRRTDEVEVPPNP